MDQMKMGKLIKQFRTELGMTQKQLADRLSVSDKTVSKWECGSGCPDISLLSALAEVFGTDIQVLLKGEIDKNESEKGNMKKLRFYVCKECGNVITSTSEAKITCCGNVLTPLEFKKAEGSEMLKVEDTGGEWYITSDHPMTKEHYITFAAYVSEASVMMFRQYPEWSININLPMYRSGRLLWYCNRCGAFFQELRPQRNR
ncbi:MAG: helix-turn-helix domain-containing protein [Ruminococcus sp.]|nr:helix-turn-helix domain-containing protein [Ruminococcus sp.]